jgi:hypothetical protein
MMRLVFFALLSTAAALTFPAEAFRRKKCEQQDHYIMTYHAAGKTWIDSDGMHIAHSNDGHNWEKLNGVEEREQKFAPNNFGRNLMLKPQVGRDRLLMARLANGEKLLRDPFVIQDPRTEKFHALWTTGWASQTIGHSASDDLVNWEPQQDLNVMKGHHDTINTWAPEAIYDDYKEHFVIFWSSAKGPTWTGPQDFHNRPFALYYTTTKDFKDFTDPMPLFNTGHSTIDATMDKVNGKYLLTYKNEDKKTLHTAISDSPTGGFRKLSDVFDGAATEGPSMTEGKDGEWLLFHDTYEKGGYGVLSSKSAYGPWTDISKDVNVPKGARHATVLKVSADKIRQMTDALEQKNAGKWATPAKMEKLKQISCEL